MDVIYTIIETILPFEFLKYDFMKNAFLAVLIITPLFAILGTMTVSNNMAFFSDALGHSALTGIALGIALGINNDIICMIAFGIFLALLIAKVKRANTASSDTIISVFSSLSIAVGLIILSKGGSFAKYSTYLIGDILSVDKIEIIYILILFVVLFVIWSFIFNKLLIVSINFQLAKSRSIKAFLYENIFIILVALTVMLSIKWVGMLVINSLLILPAAASRNISRNTKQYFFISIFISLFSGIGGLIFSYYFDTSAGASMSVIAALMFFVTYLMRQIFGLRRG
jgi:ABC-type Mn2+/Zn2+ transport systems, permease components